MGYTKVRRDEALKLWRVICPDHGELAAFGAKGAFWVASRDAAQHDRNWHAEQLSPLARSENRSGPLRTPGARG